MAEDRYDDLARDLTALGRGIDPPVATERLATAVMDRVAALPCARTGAEPVVPGPSGRSRRRIAVVVAAVLLALLATPPVRATVADWFGFGGVVVKPGAPERGSGLAAAHGAVGRDRSPAGGRGGGRLHRVGAGRARHPRRGRGLRRPPGRVDELVHRRGRRAAPRPVRRAARLDASSSTRPASSTSPSARPTDCGSTSRTRSPCSSPTAPRAPSPPAWPGRR